ncbi:hypothetical protein CHS0354_008760 [Potamilus streckersoni]|uniref:NADH dehydrogenase [ubiquinone] 1 alpha subcomplex assembly factor 2 n=1 Tax=Potamilus streckersoni TaxID=2493646 RepID=A0AAE0SFB5_9BIVA|nr:hypothetical protein CHS0354_008760 [Potamilus streckersoni]
MSKRPGYLAQLWQNLKTSVYYARKQKEHFMGQDQYGNKYFEKEADPSRNLRGSRYVLPPSKDLFQVPEIPTEWNAWLRKRRVNPPTEEEIEKNFLTMVRTQQRAKELEKSNREASQTRKEKEEQGSPEIRYTEEKFPIYPGFETEPEKQKKVSDDEKR